MTTTRTAPPRPSALQVVLELAATTFGVFLSRDAHEEGVSPSALSRLRARGAVESLSHGVNRVVAIADSWEARALTALWSGGSGLALARWAALRILLDRGGSPPIELVGPRTLRRRGATAAVRTHLRLRATDIHHAGAFRVTSLTFTICDLAAVTTVRELVRLADRCIAEDRLSLEELRVTVGRFWHIEGVGKLREMLAELSPESRWTRSDGERSWRRLVAASGLPALTANVRVRDADGQRRYLDFAWADLKVAFEVDLHPSHARTVGRNADGTRQNALVLRGWAVYRFDLADLMLRPDHVLATLIAAYDRATAS